MPKTKAQLIAEAQVVKNATEVGENTATRVGGVLEDLASDGTTFSTGEFIGDVGIDSTPTQGSDNLVKSGGVWDSVSPIAQAAENVNGSIPANFTLSVTVDSSGVESTNAAFAIATDFIPVKQGDIIKWRHGGSGSSSNRNLISYDANKNYLSSWYTSTTNEQSTTLSNASVAYIRLCFRNTTATDWTTTYVKVNDKLAFTPRGYMVPLLNDYDFFRILPLNCAIGSLTNTGTIDSASVRRVSLYDVSAHIGKRVFCYPYNSGSSTASVALYDSNMTFVNALDVGTSNGAASHPYDFVIPTGVAYVRVMTAGALTHDFLYGGGIAAEKTQMPFSISMSGRANVLVDSPCLYGFIAGHTYRLYVKNTAIDMSGVTLGSGNSKLYVIAYDANMTIVASSAELGINVKIAQTLISRYDFTIPSTATNLEYIRIRMRAASGAVQTFQIVDITDSVRATFVGASISQFNRIAVIGDSWSSGYYYSDASTLRRDIRKYSWIANLARRNGVYWWNFATGGGTVASFLGKQEAWRNDSATGVNAFLAAPPCDLYFIRFGSNERTHNESYPIGSIEDVNDADYTQNANTFYGNNARVVQMIQEKNPNAKIVWITGTTPSTYTGTTTTDGDLVQPRLDIIAHFGIAQLSFDEDPWYAMCIRSISNYELGGHPDFTAMSGMACAIERIFTACVERHRAYFQNFYDTGDFNIGTDTNPNTNEG